MPYNNNTPSMSHVLFDPLRMTNPRTLTNRLFYKLKTF